ncbi:vitamin B12 transporter [Litorimonas taeanensis]|uniref:Vitamin B12 transporter n=1 Tax=Litorimonas taeanensis TaxID=568099 RepID=A0A420WD67_9PROT|nr:TonB-dependent receptor [Litorimonas taeanensis]RKQ68926.1 vitamin B12 transporter [Litorimonas taeanensis]
MKRLLLGVALSTLAPTVWAQNTANDRDDIISIGSLIDTADTDTLTSPVSILTAADIEARNQAFVTDLLRTIPGLAVSQSGGGGSLTQIRLRGSEANHVLVIIDGVEVNNPSDGAFDFGGLRSEDVEKIEVLRGEQSALYGPDAVGGVINIITRTGNVTKQWRASAEAGSRGTVEGQFTGVIPIGRAALTVNGNAFNTEGFDVSGLGGEKDGSSSRRLALGLNNFALGSVTFSANGAVNLRTSEYDEDLPDQNFIFDGRLDNSDSETDVKTTTARIDARFSLAGFEHLVQSNMVETETDTKASFATKTTGTRQNASWAAKRTFAEAHSFTVLGEVEREEYEFEGDEDVPDIYNYGLVADYKFSQNNLDLTGSVRHDINDVFSDTTTWRVGAGYGFNWNGRLRGSVGTGVKNPTLIELFGFFPNSRFTGNPDLKAETSLGYSLGYEQAFGDLNVSIDYFHSDLEDEITTIFNPDFTSSVINLATDSTREGIEVAANWSLTDRFTLDGSASFLDSSENEIEEIRRPDFLASATLSWQASDTVSFTLSADHTGSQLDTDFGTFQRVELDAYTLVGLNIAVDINDHFGVYVRGTNLLSEDYQEVFGYRSAGAGAFTGIRAAF